MLPELRNLKKVGLFVAKVKRHNQILNIDQTIINFMVVKNVKDQNSLLFGMQSSGLGQNKRIRMTGYEKRHSKGVYSSFADTRTDTRSNKTHQVRTLSKERASHNSKQSSQQTKYCVESTTLTNK